MGLAMIFLGAATLVGLGGMLRSSKDDAQFAGAAVLVGFAGTVLVLAGVLAPRE